MVSFNVKESKANAIVNSRSIREDHLGNTKHLLVPEMKEMLFWNPIHVED